MLSLTRGLSQMIAKMEQSFCSKSAIISQEGDSEEDGGARGVRSVPCRECLEPSRTGPLPCRPGLRKRFAGGLAICKAFFKIRILLRPGVGTELKERMEALQACRVVGVGTGGREIDPINCL